MPLVTDFDGNGKAELTVFRPTDSTWYTMNTLTGAITTQSFGLNGDIPIPSDFDGDSKTDVAVFRPTNNTWYFVYSSDSGFRFRSFGSAGEKPSPASAQPR